MMGDKHWWSNPKRFDGEKAAEAVPVELYADYYDDPDAIKRKAPSSSAPSGAAYDTGRSGSLSNVDALIQQARGLGAHQSTHVPGSKRLKWERPQEVPPPYPTTRLAHKWPLRHTHHAQTPRVVPHTSSV